MTEHGLYQALAGTTTERQQCYRELFRNALHSIRQSLNSCLVLGNERFMDEIEIQLKRKVRPGKAGRPPGKWQSDPV